ncbi:hypothetical protein BKA64DRAFT_709183 [Cadophora sp. MPI-SDFR-AT-0126]|nr:hypothetical protein BKA64DRAFT_709183 [Leotiomycetes sp. MPI-SDFR-AT-0126]
MPPSIPPDPPAKRIIPLVPYEASPKRDGDDSNKKKDDKKDGDTKKTECYFNKIVYSCLHQASHPHLPRIQHTSPCTCLKIHEVLRPSRASNPQLFHVNHACSVCIIFGELLDMSSATRTNTKQGKVTTSSSADVLTKDAAGPITTSYRSEDRRKRHAIALRMVRTENQKKNIETYAAAQKRAEERKAGRIRLQFDDSRLDDNVDSAYEKNQRLLREHIDLMKAINAKYGNGHVTSSCVPAAKEKAVIPDHSSTKPATQNSIASLQDEFASLIVSNHSSSKTELPKASNVLKDRKSTKSRGSSTANTHRDPSRDTFVVDLLKKSKAFSPSKYDSSKVVDRKVKCGPVDCSPHTKGYTSTEACGDVKDTNDAYPAYMEQSTIISRPSVSGADEKSMCSSGPSPLGDCAGKPTNKSQHMDRLSNYYLRTVEDDEARKKSARTGTPSARLACRPAHSSESTTGSKPSTLVNDVVSTDNKFNNSAPRAASVNEAKKNSDITKTKIHKGNENATPATTGVSTSSSLTKTTVTAEEDFKSPNFIGIMPHNLDTSLMTNAINKQDALAASVRRPDSVKWQVPGTAKVTEKDLNFDMLGDHTNSFAPYIRGDAATTTFNKTGPVPTTAASPATTTERKVEAWDVISKDDEDKGKGEEFDGKESDKEVVLQSTSISTSTSSQPSPTVNTCHPKSVPSNLASNLTTDDMEAMAVVLAATRLARRMVAQEVEDEWVDLAPNGAANEVLAANRAKTVDKDGETEKVDGEEWEDLGEELEEYDFCS